MCSRREADLLIESGQILVDGVVVDTLGTKVDEKAHIELLDSAKKTLSSKVTILLNKPLGFLSTPSQNEYRAAKELVIAKNQVGSGRRLKSSDLEKLAVVGRLDINSKGLLVFTQDGVLAKQLIGERSDVEKEYLVRVSGKITKEKLKLLCYGLFLDKKHLKRAVVEEIQPQLLRFILKQGKKRQIRRMCELVELECVSLKRVRVGKIVLASLPVGKWRFLKKNEVFK